MFRKEFFIITVVFLIGFSYVLVPDAEARDFVIISECVDGVWQATITKEDGEPLSNVKVVPMKSAAAYRVDEKLYTDEFGLIVLSGESNLGYAKFTRGGYNDQTIETTCQSVQKTVPPITSEDAPPKIPEWIKTIFKLFLEDQISEDELISALQFLIKQGIIKV